MTKIKVGAASLNQTPLDWEGNARRIREAMTRARAQSVAILCLPELCITGYGCEDAFMSGAVRRRALSVLQELQSESQGLVVALSLPLEIEGELYDVACLLADGNILGFVGKQNLARDGIHYEPRWFRPWPVGKKVTLEIDGVVYPVGDLLFSIGGVRIGFEICEDAWVAKRPGGSLAGLEVDVLLNPSASHFAFGKYEVRKNLVLDGSRNFGVAYIYANLVGNEAGRALYDGSLLIAQGDVLLASGRRFSYHDVNLCTATIDIAKLRAERTLRALNRGPSHLVESSFALLSATSNEKGPEQEVWEVGERAKEEEFARAVSLGLFDYLRKSYSCGFVLSLSGGADSATVAVLCALMTKFALNDLGLDGYRKKLSYINALAGTSDREITKQLLTCVYQATANSSDVTRGAARTVAQAVGAEFLELDVEELASGYRNLIANALGITLSWEMHDLALQNIQARVRAPSVWMIANLKKALLLATSNRSEMAVGYTTMDGDTCGGLSPIAGVDKAFVRRWLRWMETSGPEGLERISELRAVNSQEPTAELRPLDRQQRDEQDLMPYEVLDAIERSAIRDKLSAEEILPLLEKEFPKTSIPQLQLWIVKFFRLWSQNQWKRERYAPCFHLDDENLDPKTWCRWPILSGGGKL